MRARSVQTALPEMSLPSQTESGLALAGRSPKMSPSVTSFGERFGHLDADGLLAGDRRQDADLGRRERVREVVLEPCDLRHLRARRELELVAGHARAGDLPRAPSRRRRTPRACGRGGRRSSRSCRSSTSRPPETHGAGAVGQPVLRVLRRGLEHGLHALGSGSGSSATRGRLLRVARPRRRRRDTPPRRRAGGARRHRGRRPAAGRRRPRPSATRSTATRTRVGAPSPPASRRDPSGAGSLPSTRRSRAAGPRRAARRR